MIRHQIRGLYGIIDNTPVPERSHLWLAEQYLKGGVGILQLRMKGASRSDFFKVARQIAGLKKNYRFVFILNDHLDLVTEVGADGYHGGKEDPLPGEAKKILGDKVVGYSSHSLEEALRAEQAGADYVAFGAIFPSPLKGPGHPVQGIERLQRVVSAVSIPVVAIGGINRDTLQKVLATGVPSVAMITGLASAAQPAKEAEYYAGLFL